MQNIRVFQSLQPECSGSSHVTNRDFSCDYKTNKIDTSSYGNHARSSSQQKFPKHHLKSKSILNQCNRYESLKKLTQKSSSPQMCRDDTLLYQKSNQNLSVVSKNYYGMKLASPHSAVLSYSIKKETPANTTSKILPSVTEARQVKALYCSSIQNKEKIRKIKKKNYQHKRQISLRESLDKRSLSTKGKFSTRESIMIDHQVPTPQESVLASLNTQKGSLESKFFDKRDIELRHLREKVSKLEENVITLEQINWELQNFCQENPDQEMDKTLQLQSDISDLLNPLNRKTLIKSLQNQIRINKKIKQKNETLTAENKRLKNKCLYYRNIVTELQHQSKHPVFRPPSKASDFQDSDFDTLERKYEIFEELVLHEYKHSEMLKADDPETVLNQTHEVSNIVLFLGKLNKLFTKLITCNSLNNIMTEIEEILKQILHCNRVSFLLKDEEVIKIFNEEDKGLGQNISIDNYGFVLVSPNAKFSKKSKIIRSSRLQKQEESSLFQPCFDDLEAAFYGKADKKVICHSVCKSEKIRKSKRFDPSAIYLVIQCEKHKSDKTRFSMNHLYALNLFNTMISECIEKTKVSFKMNMRDRISKNLLSSFKDVAYDKNLASIHLSVADSCSSIFEAKKANIFFVDHENPKFMYAITTVGTDPGGTKFISTYAKYPASYGYTGHCIQTHQITVYQDGVKKYRKNSPDAELEYISEIDNFVLEADVRNAIYGPCFDQHGKIQGVLQIINKVHSSESFTEECYPEMESICGVIGSAIAHANSVDNTMNMNWKMQGVMEKMDLITIKGDDLLADSSKTLEQYLIDAKDNFNKIKRLTKKKSSFRK
ncbi:unnamed protein product [Moneuplotes crassus]|uniref:GAF domain-containing protein n=1 Tax=Euplotes crassus TaxID=5936 RepID=A0AAD2CZK1_EUPCR|nr:unnamed protein product [Moneuplotes crassus]